MQRFDKVDDFLAAVRAGDLAGQSVCLTLRPWDSVELAFRIERGRVAPPVDTVPRFDEVPQVPPGLRDALAMLCLGAAVGGLVVGALLW